MERALLRSVAAGRGFLRAPQPISDAGQRFMLRFWTWERVGVSLHASLYPLKQAGHTFSHGDGAGWPAGGSVRQGEAAISNKKVRREKNPFLVRHVRSHLLHLLSFRNARLRRGALGPRVPCR